MTDPIKPAAPKSDVKVPDDLVDQLHGATQKFHDARRELETQMDAPQFRYQERVDAAADRVREAEHEVEAVEASILKKIHPGADSATADKGT